LMGNPLLKVKVRKLKKRSKTKWSGYQFPDKSRR
jgi:hypothetical protein